jgi:hypothetical protein
MAQAQTYAPFGETDVPYAEPAWYFGQPTPYYMDKHAKWRKQVSVPAACCLRVTHISERVHGASVLGARLC